MGQIPENITVKHEQPKTSRWVLAAYIALAAAALALTADIVLGSVQTYRGKCGTVYIENYTDESR